MTAGIGNDLRITARMRFGGVAAIQNVYSVTITGGTPSSDFDIMTDIATWLDGAYGQVISHIPDDVLFLDITGYNETQDVPLPPVAWPTQTSGSGGSVAYASGVAAVVLFYTAVSRVVGRKFLPPFNESAWNDGLLESSAFADCADYALAILANPPSTASGATMKFQIKALGGAGNEVIRVAVNAIAAYQRRRRPGTGV